MTYARLRSCLFAIGLATCAAPLSAAPVNFNMSDWVAEGGNWTVHDAGNTVRQTSNSPPTVYHSGQNDLFSRYSGSFRVNTSGDDDFIGFVIGYTAGDIDYPNDGLQANSDIDYLLIDWKQANQTNATLGMAISRVTGDIYEIGDSGEVTVQADAWKHDGVVEEIKRADTLGNMGWVDYQTYGFTLEYLPSVVRLHIGDIAALEVTPGEVGLTSFQAGSFGLYGFSQTGLEVSNVRYESLPQVSAAVSTVPLPAGLPLVIAGMGALAILRRRRA